MNEPPRRDLHHASTRVLSAVMVVLGVVLVVRTLARGGGPFAIGVVFGVLFFAAGAARLYLGRAQR
jgi:hypothetical protein